MSELVFLDSLYQLGANEWFDVVAGQPYDFGEPVAAAPAPERLNWRRLELLYDVMQSHGDEQGAVWATAFGQTAMDPESGAPKKETLRTMRVILRGTPFRARLEFVQEPIADETALLAACVKALRRAGTGRNRGRGRLKAQLLDDAGDPVTEGLFGGFRKAVVL